MAKERTITGHFSPSRRYFENTLGPEFDFTQSTGPYEYLLGALSGCFYSTLASFPSSSGWDGMDIKVTGRKREDIPTTLEHTMLDITVHGAEDESEVRSLVLRAAEECSIFQTLCKVSRMEITVKFES